ncbi:(2Fe-2S)-binding protein [Achromobacter sp. AGC39]
MAILKRLAESGRPAVPFTLNGQACTALAGDTVLTAVLTQADCVRHSEFSGAPRAGFCMMGACQDCWMQLEDGSRLRACSTFIEPDMRLLTVPMAPAAVPGTLAAAPWPEDDIA